MPCQSLADALGDLITVANSAGGLGPVLANLPDSAWLPTDAETPPEEGVPPEGFETWSAYLTWKCQAAWAVWHEVDRVMIMLEGFYGLGVVASVIVPTIFAFTAMSWVAVPVSGVAILVVSILAMVAVWGSNVLIMDQMRTWWSDHQDAIVCQLYNSGDAATALTAIGDNIEDAIQAIEWGSLLPFAGPLGDALATTIGVFQNNSLVNPLFKLITGVVLIEVECPCNIPPEQIWWHFSADLEGWTHYNVWPNGRTITLTWQNPGHNGNDPQDDDTISQGLLELHTTGPNNNFDTGVRIVFPELSRPVAASGWYFHADCKNAPTGKAWSNHGLIVYADDTADVQEWGDIESWSHQTVAVSSGNVGKYIKEFRVQVHAGSDVGEGWMSVDNCHYKQGSG